MEEVDGDVDGPWLAEMVDRSSVVVANVDWAAAAVCSERPGAVSVDVDVATADEGSAVSCSGPLAWPVLKLPCPPLCSGVCSDIGDVVVDVVAPVTGTRDFVAREGEVPLPLVVVVVRRPGRVDSGALDTCVGDTESWDVERPLTDPSSVRSTVEADPAVDSDP